MYELTTDKYHEELAMTNKLNIDTLVKYFDSRYFLCRHIIEEHDTWVKIKNESNELDIVGMYIFSILEVDGLSEENAQEYFEALFKLVGDAE